MKILFVTGENPACLSGGHGNFVREYVKELRNFVEVVCVYLHFGEGAFPSPDDFADYVFAPGKVFDAFSNEAVMLEKCASLRGAVNGLVNEFAPDVIHCNDWASYMVFRFDKKVFYSAHLNFCTSAEKIPGEPGFFEAKAERCALENSSAVAVYSDFAADAAEKITGGRCISLVLPAGLRFEKFLKIPQKKKVPESGENLMVAETAEYSVPRKKLRIGFFGRLDKVRNGVTDFIFAVNRIGKAFKEKYALEYSLFGDGKILSVSDLSLFDNIRNPSEEELVELHKKTDIVVIPSRYEPFGFAGLEAMASGSLVLVSRGLGMDMYAEPGYNCLEIPHNPEGIAEVLKDAVINFSAYKLIRDNGVRTSLKWNWRRCVLAHMYVYRQIIQGRLSQLACAYRKEERKVLEAYRKSSDVEKLYSFENEKKGLFRVLNSVLRPGLICKGETDPESYLEMVRVLEREDRCFLILTGTYVPDAGYLSSNVEVFSVLNEGFDGITVRAECLPFDDGEFDAVIFCGAWESVIDPCGALVEAQRVSRGEVIVLYNKKLPYSWQTFQIENEKDWEKLTGEGWTVDNGKRIMSGPDDMYGSVTFSSRKKLKAEDECSA